MPEQKPELAHHLEVEGRPLAEPGRLEHPALGLELADPLLHLRLDVDDRALQLVGRRDVVGGRVDVDLLALGEQLAGQRVQLRDPLDLVAEELDPDEGLLRGRLELEGVAADPEPGARRGPGRCAGTGGRRAGGGRRRGGTEPPWRSRTTVAP